jgi:hypothetical protein
MKSHIYVVICSLLALLIAACAPPPLPPVCYRYNFVASATSSNGTPINIQSGQHVPGSGIQTTLEGELIANWGEDFFIDWSDVAIEIARPAGVSGNIDIQFIANVFGVSFQENGTLTSDLNSATLYFENYGTNEASRYVSTTVQSSQQLVVRSFTVYVEGANPFPRNDCAPPTATRTATQTGTFTPTRTPSATPTATRTATPTFTPTGSPTATATPYCVLDSYLYNNAAYSGMFGGTHVTGNGVTTAGIWLSPGNASSSYVTLNLPDQVNANRIDIVFHGSMVLTQLKYQFRLNGQVVLDVNSGTWGTQVSGTSASSPRWRLSPSPNLVFNEIRMWGQYQSSLNRTMWLFNTIDITHCIQPNTATPTRTNTATATLTHTPTHTYTPTPSRTPLFGTPVTRTPSPTGIGVNTRTPVMTPSRTSTYQPPPTNTPPPPPTLPPYTPPPSWTPPPTSTLIPMPTELNSTITPFATYPGANLTPLPGTPGYGEGDIPGTPQLGTLASTPQVGETAIPVPDDLRDAHPVIQSSLGTAVAQVNALPQDISGVVPGITRFNEFAGYARWVISGVSLQEIFGQTLYVIPLHFTFALTAVMFVSAIMLVFRFVMWFLKFANWIVRFILKIIPFIG